MFHHWTYMLYKQLPFLCNVVIKLKLKLFLFDFSTSLCSIQVGGHKGCHEMLRVKIQESVKAGSHQESNPGHFWLEPPVLCHWATTAGWPPTLTILYIYCTGGTEYLSHTPGSHSVCAVRTLLGVDWKILSIRKEPMLSGSHSKYSEYLASHWK